LPITLFIALKRIITWTWCNKSNESENDDIEEVKVKGVVVNDAEELKVKGVKDAIENYDTSFGANATIYAISEFAGEKLCPKYPKFDTFVSNPVHQGGIFFALIYHTLECAILVVIMNFSFDNDETDTDKTVELSPWTQGILAIKFAIILQSVFWNFYDVLTATFEDNILELRSARRRLKEPLCYYIVIYSLLFSYLFFQWVTGLFYIQLLSSIFYIAKKTFWSMAMGIASVVNCAFSFTICSTVFFCRGVDIKIKKGKIKKNTSYKEIFCRCICSGLYIMIWLGILVTLIIVWPIINRAEFKKKKTNSGDWSTFVFAPCLLLFMNCVVLAPSAICLTIFCCWLKKRDKKKLSATVHPTGVELNPLEYKESPVSKGNLKQKKSRKREFSGRQVAPALHINEVQQSPIQYKQIAPPSFIPYQKVCKMRNYTLN